MTAQDAIKSFMNALANHGCAYSDSVGENILDFAVKASSRFSSVQSVIDAMKADQIAAEKLAVEEILGNDHAGKTIAEIDSSVLSSDAKNYDSTKLSNAYYNDANDYRTTVESVIRERKAYIFLKKYCGIQLPTRFYLDEAGEIFHWNNWTTGNVDTGAITGSDANITLSAGDVVGDKILTAEDVISLATQDGISLSDDGKSIVIGSGTEKTDRSVVEEIFVNTYTASNSAAQIINTGSRNWLVQATDSDDTITSNGADSINACAGDDVITANADGATITTGVGADKINISAEVREITITDLNVSDKLTISGTFEVGSAQIEDMLLVITDKTGTRKIKLGDFTDSLNAKINSTTIGAWLSAAGINLDNLTAANNISYSSHWNISSNVNSGNISDENNARIAPDKDYIPSTVKEIIPSESISPTPKRRLLSSKSSGATTVNLDDFTSLTSAQEVSGGSVSSTFPNAETFTRNGLTIHLLGESSNSSSTNITAKNLDALSDSQKAIVAGLFKWWISDCLKLNKDSYGLDFNSDTAVIREIGLYFYTDENSDTLAAITNWKRNTQDGVATQLMLNVNMKYYGNVSATDLDGEGKYILKATDGGEDSIISGGLLDRTLAHEFTHAIMASNINFFNALPLFVKEGIAELTHGIDDERTSRIFGIAYDDTRLNDALNLSNTGTGESDGYAGGFMFYRYFAKQAALQTLFNPAFGDITATVNLNGDGDYYISSTSTSEIASTFSGGIKIGTLTDGVYTVINTGVHQIISAGDTAIKISGLTANDIFNGGSGADTIETSEGAFISTGEGNDSINLRGQYATINAGADNDTVSIVDGSHHSINLGDGDNLVEINPTSSYNNTIRAGSGNDTIKDDIKNHYDYDLDLGDGNNLISLSYIENSTIKTGNGADTVSVGSAVTKSNLIIFGSGNDSILFGGANNTINGGEGNDYLNS